MIELFISLSLASIAGMNFPQNTDDSEVDFTGIYEGYLINLDSDWFYKTMHLDVDCSRKYVNLIRIESSGGDGKADLVALRYDQGCFGDQIESMYQIYSEMSEQNISNDPIGIQNLQRVKYIKELAKPDYDSMLITVMGKIDSLSRINDPTDHINRCSASAVMLVKTSYMEGSPFFLSDCEPGFLELEKYFNSFKADLSKSAVE